MAFNMAASGQLVFFDKLFGPSNHLNLVKSLIASGVKFEVGAFSVKATIGTQSFEHPLIKSSNSFIKEQVDPGTLNLQRVQVFSWLTTLKVIPTPVVAVSPPSLQVSAEKFYTVTLHSVDAGFTAQEHKIYAIKTLKSYTYLPLKEAKGIIDSVQAGEAQKMPGTYNAEQAKTIVAEFTKLHVTCEVTETAAAPFVVPNPTVTKPLPSSAVMSLREAQAIGQKVRGTSDGSVYVTVAVGERVKLAVKKSGDTGPVSIRAEWKNATQAEKTLLSAAGMSLKNDYASIHLTPTMEAKAPRIIGAFIMGLGVEWQDAVISAQQLEKVVKG